MVEFIVKSLMRNVSLDSLRSLHLYYFRVLTATEDFTVPYENMLFVTGNGYDIMIYETFYNRYRGWGTGSKPNGEVIFIMRSKGHVLSPSVELLKDWQNRAKNKMTWSDYKRRFFDEMNSSSVLEEIRRLADLSHNKDIWLVCSCYNSKKECHRYLVLDYIRQAGGLVEEV